MQARKQQAEKMIVRSIYVSCRDI